MSGIASTRLSASTTSSKRPRATSVWAEARPTTPAAPTTSALTTPSVRRRRDDPQHLGLRLSRIAVPVRAPALEGQAVALVHEIGLAGDVKLQRSLENDHALFVRVMRIGLLPGALAGLDDAQDDLEAMSRLRREKEVFPVALGMHHARTLARGDETPGRPRAVEERADGRAERLGDPPQRRHARICDTALDLRDEAARHAREVGELAQGHPALLTQPAHRVPENRFLRLQGALPSHAAPRGAATAVRR